jgi:prepilin-type N-terminal cleavage/methylation domain-containing protein
MKRMNKSQRGFTLLEMLIAASLGLCAVLVMMTLFKNGMDTAMKVTQRAEVQQNLRAGIELMTKDIGLAGAGLPSGGLALSTAGLSKYACNQSGTCYITSDTYPNSSTGSANYMYAIEPGYGTGVQGGATIPSAPSATNSSITVAYCDYNFPLEPGNFTFSFPSSTTASVAVVNSAVLPNNILAPGGLNVGDLLFFQVVTPGNGSTSTGTSMVQNAAVVAEITGIPNNTTIDFATGDALNMNFTTGSNNLGAVAAAALGTNAQMSVCRLEVVSYFIQVPATGGTVQTPRLMRQVNGLTAIPVADNIINLQFTYDVISSVNGTIVANQSNPIGAGENPSLIQKVNIWMMGTSLTPDGNRAQNMYLATSVATSNMSFCNSFSSSTTQCQ